jgi:hypothetical protein
VDIAYLSLNTKLRASRRSHENFVYVSSGYASAPLQDQVRSIA